MVVVDDDSLDREAIIRMLGSQYVVFQASTASEGIEAVRSYQPHCVLLDYRLPDMDGIDALTLLAVYGAPIVMLTGQGDEELAVESMKVGAFDYLPKHRLKEARLVGAVARAIESSELRQRVAESQRELEDFVGAASLDLEDPLSAIGGLLQATIRAVSEKLDEQQICELKKAGKLAAELQSRMRKLVAFVQQSEMDVEFGDVSLDEVLESARASLSSEFEETRAELLATRLPVVRASREPIENVVRSLLENALRFRGDVAPVIRVSAKLEHVEWLISVRDNGVGVPAEHRETIFAPLQRLHRGKSGHGLGLASCRRIVRRLGGRIWVAEAEGGGADFRFTLPATADQLSNWGRT
ncbi:MAG: response regulator [Planctomycetales bacterium]|nr:response regulator [Planctomycetales bacterium]